MKRSNLSLLLVGVMVFASILACDFSFSTANIADAWMATDESGAARTSAYSPEAIFYAMVDLQNAPEDTTLKAVWTVVNAQDTEPNLVLTETEFTSGDGLVHFTLENTDYLWPPGQYKVEIYLNGELESTLNFEVQ